MSEQELERLRQKLIYIRDTACEGFDGEWEGGAGEGAEEHGYIEKTASSIAEMLGLEMPEYVRKTECNVCNQKEVTVTDDGKWCQNCGAYIV